jgi:hypothetical protein
MNMGATGHAMELELDLVFPSQGVPLTGRLLRNTPDLSVRQPAVIVTGSWLTVKEQMPLVYARELAKRGYTAFIFDFAGFGTSGGELRQAEIPVRKISHIVDAAEFISRVSFVTAVGHLAICASAQYALAAIARGAPIDSFVSVAGWYHDGPSVAPFYGGAEAVLTRIRAASDAAAHFAKTRELATVPAYEPGNALAGMSFELDYYANPRRGAVPEWKNAMATLSWLHWLTFDGLTAAGRVVTPTLFVHGDGCVLPENVRGIHASLPGPNELVWHEGSQTDFYDDPNLVTMASEAADTWFQKTLSPRDQGQG